MDNSNFSHTIISSFQQHPTVVYKAWYCAISKPILWGTKSPIGSRELEAVRCIENIRTTELNEEMLFLAPALPLRHSPSSTKGEEGRERGERESFPVVFTLKLLQPKEPTDRPADLLPTAYQVHLSKTRRKEASRGEESAWGIEEGKLL